MSETSQSSTPIAHGPGEGEAYWFFGGLTTIKATAGQTAGRVAVSENLAPRGSGSPLHVHHREDEWFYVLEGELTFWVAGEVIAAPAGSFVYGPRDIPHTFVVSSDQARYLLVVEPAGFEELRPDARRARPAPRDPAPADPPGPEAMEAIMRAAAAHGIDIIGPPGIPEA